MAPILRIWINKCFFLRNYCKIVSCQWWLMQYIFIKVNSEISKSANLSPVPEHSCTKLGPLIPVLDWFLHLHSFSWQYRTDRTPDWPDAGQSGIYKTAFPYCYWWKDTLHVHPAGGGKRHHSHPYCGCLKDTMHRMTVLTMVYRHYWMG